VSCEFSCRSGVGSSFCEISSIEAVGINGGEERHLRTMEHHKVGFENEAITSRTAPMMNNVHNTAATKMKLNKEDLSGLEPSTPSKKCLEEKAAKSFVANVPGFVLQMHGEQLQRKQVNEGNMVVIGNMQMLHTKEQHVKHDEDFQISVKLSHDINSATNTIQNTRNNPNENLMLQYEQSQQTRLKITERSPGKATTPSHVHEMASKGIVTSWRNAKNDRPCSPSAQSCNQQSNNKTLSKMKNKNDAI